MKLRETQGTLSWICKAAAGVNRMVIVLSGIQMLQGAAAIIKALLLGQAVNKIVAGNRQGFIYALCGFIALVVLQIAFNAIFRYLNELTVSKMENRLKSQLFSALLDGNYSDVTRTHSGEWMNRLTSDTTVVAGTFVSVLPDFVGLVVRLGGALFAIMFIEPRLVIFLAAGGLLLIVLTRVFRRIMKSLHKNVQEADGRLRVFLQERLNSLLIIKSFVQEAEASAQAADYMNEHKAARMKRSGFLNLFYSGYSVGINGIYILGICFCGFGLLNGTMPFGNLIVLLQLLEQVQGPFAGFTGFLPKYYAMIASAERLREAESFAEDHSCFTEDVCRNIYENDFRSLGLKNAHFTYKPLEDTEDLTEAPEALSNFSFEISKGEQIAFTGPSGCGKSTVLKLLMGLYPLDSGEAYLLTNDKKCCLTSEYRSMFAYVPQGNQLLNGSIREAVAFGNRQKMNDDPKIQQALKIACADEFVNELDSGLDTMLGERGAGLSEGQMQRIAIARAVFSEHPILLLDESTSALDEATADKLLYNLREMTNRTVIMVTHRSNNIQMFDKEIRFSKSGYVEETSKCR